MQQHEQAEQSLSFDFRTGRATAICGTETGRAQQAACATLNAIRTRGILEATQNHASGESLPLNVWTASID